MRAQRGRPTLEAVAAVAGVSRATVSRVVNGSTSVDPKVARRVRAAIDELNYVPNQAARALMTRRTNVIALVAAEEDDRVFGDPFFSSITRGVSQELRSTGHQLMLFMSQGDSELGSVESFLTAGHCDGVLLISEHGHHETAAKLARAGIPVVVGGRPLDASVGVPYVDNDNVGGGALAARHLSEVLCRRRIAHIAGPQDMAAGVDRLMGFSRTLGAAFDPDLVEIGDFTGPSGAAAMTRLLERAPDLDAVFAASDLMALSAIGVIQRSGRQVPGDIAVVGFDDIAMAAQGSPRLTTVRQNTVEQGRRMALTLSRVIEARVDRASATATGGDPIDGDPIEGVGIVLPVRLVVRDSA